MLGGDGGCTTNFSGNQRFLAFQNRHQGFENLRHSHGRHIDALLRVRKSSKAPLVFGLQQQVVQPTALGLRALLQ